MRVVMVFMDAQDTTVRQTLRYSFWTRFWPASWVLRILRRRMTLYVVCPVPKKEYGR